MQDLRWLRVAAAGVLLLVNGCLSENVEVKSVGTEPQGFVTGGVLNDPPPNAAVILYEANGMLRADVRWVGTCSRTERGWNRRVRVQTKEVSTTTKVLTGIFAVSGLAVFVWPDLDAETSLYGGSIVAGIGGLIYLIPKLQEKETTENLPPREVERPASPAPCFVGRAKHEQVVIKGSDATLEGRTNASGRVQFDATVSAPVEVIVRGRPAGKVEWQK